MFGFFNHVGEAISSGVNGFLQSEGYNRFKENVREATSKTAEELNKLREQAEKSLNTVKTGEIPDMVYITPKIIIMSYPFSDEPSVMSTLGRDRHLLISKYLHDHHPGHFLIVNLSDRHYDGSLFDNSIVEFFSPGYPAPPLGMLFKISWTIENWLLSDSNNVVVIHCINGKGRTITTASCFLAWSGFFPTPDFALDYVCEKRGGNRMNLLIPSQRRYVQYFGKILDGIRPASNPLRLIRVIIMNKPKFVDFTEYNPILQILKGGSILYTSEYPEVEENVVKFDIDVILQGNILIRCRQKDETNKWISLWRCGFHTGYIQNNHLSLPIQELDGPLTDKFTKFPSDFCVDLVFDDKMVIQEEKQELKEATDVYESVIGSNKSFWDEVNERKSKRTAVDGKRATKQNLINSAFGITENTIEYDNPVESPVIQSTTPAKRNYLEELASLEKELGLQKSESKSSINDTSSQISKNTADGNTSDENIDDLFTSVMNDIQSTIKPSSSSSDKGNNNNEPIQQTPPPEPINTTTTTTTTEEIDEYDIDKNKKETKPKNIPEVPSTINEESISSIPEVSNPLVNTIDNHNDDNSSSIKPNYHITEGDKEEEENNNNEKTPSKILLDNSISQLPESFTLNNNNNNNNISSHEEVSEIINEDSTFDDHNLTFEQDSSIQRKAENANNSSKQDITIVDNSISFNLDEMMNDLENIGTTTTTTTTTAINGGNALDLDDLERELEESLNH